MGWLSLLRSLLSLANIIADIVRERRLLSAGEAIATAKAVAVLQQRLGIAKEVEAETARMSESDLDRELAGKD